MQNSVMKNFHIMLPLKTLIALSVASSWTVKADIYVDLSEMDEINIANTVNEPNYTFKIEEPVLVNPVTKITTLNKVGSEDNKNLPFNNEVIIAAKITGIEPALIHAVIAVESKHNPHAQSIKGAYGLMQLMPETSRRFNVLDKNNPKQNILAGAKYLRELLKLFNGDLKLSLAAYNAGPAAVQKFGGKIPPYKETVNYVPKVLKYYKQYS
jgi:soluble lytic murein transglycosylase-like protein